MNDTTEPPKLARCPHCQRLACGFCYEIHCDHPPVEIGMAQPVIEAAKGIRQQCAQCDGSVIWHNLDHRWVHTPGLERECQEVAR